MAESFTPILQSISDVVTESLDWVAAVFTKITAEPILMLFVVCVPVVGLGIGLVRRLLNAN